MKQFLQQLRISFPPQSFFLRLLIFSAGWLILVGGKVSDLWLVVLVLILTTALSILCVPAKQWRVRPLALVTFIPYFLITALRGGWDVAKRAFYPKMPIDPGFITVALDHDLRRTLLLTWIISLLPGTASCKIDGETLVVHVLDRNLPVAAEIKTLQNYIQRIVPKCANSCYGPKNTAAKTRN